MPVPFASLGKAASSVKEYLAPKDPTRWKYGSSEHPAPGDKVEAKESAPAKAPAPAVSSGKAAPAHRGYEDPGPISAGPDKRTVKANRIAAKTKSFEAAKGKATKPTALETGRGITGKLGSVGSKMETDRGSLPTLEEKKPTSASKETMHTQRKNRPGRFKRIAGGFGRAVGRGVRYAVKGPKKRASDKST